MTEVKFRVMGSGLLVHDDWTTFPEEYVPNTYCTLSESPTLATAPAPVIRLLDSMVVGGVPFGITMVGALPKVPAGEGSGIGLIVTGPAVVVVVGAVVVVPANTVVVVVVVGDFPAKSSAAEPTTSKATIATMTLRRIVLRRLFARCSCSSF